MIARDCFLQADADRSGTITLYEFFNFLNLFFNRIDIYREVTQAECEQLFRFYDDDRNGFLTPN
jgi:Ca2+-binding EF-hand superfamily protein